MKLLKGTIITCPKCGVPQLKTTVEIGPGQQLKDAQFESLGHGMLDVNCYKCHTEWFRLSPKTGRKQIHTELDAWVPIGEPTKHEKPLIIIPPTNNLQ